MSVDLAQPRGRWVCLLLVVSKASHSRVRTALRELLCIATPFHCVAEQWPDLIRDVRGTRPPAPLKQKKTWSTHEKIAYHTRTAPSFCAVFSYATNIGACRGPLQILRQGNQPPIHGGCGTILEKNVSQGSHVSLAWYLSDRFLGGCICLNISRK